MVDTASQPILDDYAQGFGAGILVAVSALAALSLLFAIYSCCFRQPEKKVQDAGQSDGGIEIPVKKETAEVDKRREKDIERSMVRASADEKMSESDRVKITVVALEEARRLLEQNCSKTEEVVAAHQNGEIKELERISGSVDGRASALGSGKPFVRNPPASSKGNVGDLTTIWGAMSLNLPVRVDRGNSDASGVDGSPSSEGNIGTVSQLVFDGVSAVTKGVQGAANTTRNSATQLANSACNCTGSRSETNSDGSPKEDSSETESVKSSSDEGWQGLGGKITTKFSGSFFRAQAAPSLVEEGASRVQLFGRLAHDGQDCYAIPANFRAGTALSDAEKVRNFELLLFKLLHLLWPENLKLPKTFAGLMTYLKVFDLKKLERRKQKLDQGQAGSHPKENIVSRLRPNSKVVAMFWPGSKSNPKGRGVLDDVIGQDAWDQGRQSPPVALDPSLHVPTDTNSCLELSCLELLQVDFTKFGVIFDPTGDRPFKEPLVMVDYREEEIVDLRNQVITLWDCVNLLEVLNLFGPSASSITAPLDR